MFHAQLQRRYVAEMETQKRAPRLSERNQQTRHGTSHMNPLTYIWIYIRIVCIVLHIAVPIEKVDLNIYIVR
jgi:hypothetical protein